MKRTRVLIAGIAAAALVSMAALAGCIVVSPNGPSNPGTPDNPGNPGNTGLPGGEVSNAELSEIFVQGVLDTQFFGGPDAQYMDLFNVDGESVSAGNDYAVAAGVNDLVCFFGIDADAASFEAMQELSAVVRDLYDKAKYEVVNVSETNGGYTVTVKVYPLDVLGLIGTGTMMDLYDEYYVNEGKMGARAAQDEFVRGCVQALREVMGRMDYMEPETVQLPVGVSFSGNMTILDEVALDRIREIILTTEYPDAG